MVEALNTWPGSEVGRIYEQGHSTSPNMFNTSLLGPLICTVTVNTMDQPHTRLKTVLLGHTLDQNYIGLRQVLR